MCLSGGKLFINQNARFQFSKGGPFEKSENTHTATVLNWNKTQLVFSTNACRIQKVGLFNDSFNNFEDNCKYLRLAELGARPPLGICCASSSPKWRLSTLEHARLLNTLQLYSLELQTNHMRSLHYHGEGPYYMYRAFSWLKAPTSAFTFKIL